MSATGWIRLSRPRNTRGGARGLAAARKGVWSRLRFTSLRLRLVVVFGLVALTAAVSASGIAYWLNREAVLTRTQDAVLRTRSAPGPAATNPRPTRSRAV
ncbi:hypothetical protein SVIOM342S_00934 [Streptomyces violaceorubidus]